MDFTVLVAFALGMTDQDDHLRKGRVGFLITLMYEKCIICYILVVLPCWLDYYEYLQYSRHLFNELDIASLEHRVVYRNPYTTTMVGIR